MAEISIKLNRTEEKIVNFLSEYYGKDASSLFKYSLKELYMDTINMQIMHEEEAKEKEKKDFADSQKIAKMIRDQKKARNARNMSEGLPEL